MKRKEVLETQQLNEFAPLAAALMGALVGAGLSRAQAQRAAQQAAQDPQVQQAAGGGAAGGGAARPTTGGSYEDTMRTGSRGEGVRQLQQALGMQQVDGIFGPNTERAVRQFQQSQGLQVDGIVGPETRARIARVAGDDQDGAAPAAATPAAATPAAAPAGPNADQRDAANQQAAQPSAAQSAAATQGVAQNQNRLRGEPSQLKVRQAARNLPGGQNVPFTVDGFRYIRTADGRITRQTGTGQAPATQPGTVSESKKMKKSLNEASVNINGTAEEIAELMRMMQLAGAPGAKPVDATDINPGPKPCPICGKIHGPMPKPGGCGAPPMQGPKEPDMGDMLRMMSMEAEHDDGGFQDATTEPAEYTTSNAGDVSDMIPAGNDLHKEKDAYPAVNGGDNAMRIKEQLMKALAEKKKAKPDFLDMDGDGDKKEPMKKAIKDKKKNK